MKRVLSVLCCIFVLLALTGCGQRAKPEDTIQKLEDSFNRYDLSGMLECLDTPLSSVVKSMAAKDGENYSLASSLLFGIFRVGVLLTPLLTGGAVKQEMLPQLELDVEDVWQEENLASAAVSGTLSLGGYSWTFRKVVSLRMEDNQWMISAIKGEDGNE